MIALPWLLLKHGGLYTYDNPDGSMTYIRFKALVGKDDFFKAPVAEFVWQDDPTHISTTFKKPFTGQLIYSETLPFELKYGTSAWYAKLRYMEM